MRPYASVLLELKSLVNLSQRKANDCVLYTEGEALSCVQVFILDFLFSHQNQDIFQRDLERAFAIRRSSITGILNNMEQKNLICRCSDTRDARLKRLVLTEKSMALQPQISSLLEEIGSTATQGVSEEEMALFYQVAHKLKENLSR